MKKSTAAHDLGCAIDRQGRTVVIGVIGDSVVGSVMVVSGVIGSVALVGGVVGSRRWV